MSWKNYIHALCGGICIYILILIGFSVYEWFFKYKANKEIDKVLPMGEYSDDEAIIASINYDEDINDHPYLHPKLKNTLYNNLDGFKYEYSLSSAKGVYYVRRAEDGAIHQMIIWPQTVLTKDEIYFVRDVDSLIVALNKTYPLLSKSLNISSPDRKQKNFNEIHQSVKDVESIMFGQSRCRFTNEDCTDSFGIPIDVGNYRFIFEGKCGGNKKVISMFPSFYKNRSIVLELSALCIIIVIFILFIVTLQQSINQHKSNRHALPSIITSIVSKNEEIKNVGISRPINSTISFCKFCGRKIDRNSTFCNYCGKNQS